MCAISSDLRLLLASRGCRIKQKTTSYFRVHNLLIIEVLLNQLCYNVDLCSLSTDAITELKEMNDCSLK